MNEGLESVISAVVDTNIVIDVLKKFPPAVNWWSSVYKKRLAVTPIVWMEAVQGARNKYELQQILKHLDNYSLKHTNQSDHQWAIQQVTDYWLSHHLIFSDALIASVAVRLQVPLYTRNVKHFNMLPNLTASQPY